MCRTKKVKGEDMVESLDSLADQFGTILIDPPWRFTNRTGKVGPEHKRLHRYSTMSFEEIAALPVSRLTLPKSHIYLWCPNALLGKVNRLTGKIGRAHV